MIQNQLALLNVRPGDIPIHRHKLMLHVLSAAKLTIASIWWADIISVSATKSKIHWIFSNEKLSACLKDRMPIFEKIWEPWVQYFLPSSFDAQLISPSWVKAYLNNLMVEWSAFSYFLPHPPQLILSSTWRSSYESWKFFQRVVFLMFRNPFPFWTLSA